MNRWEIFSESEPFAKSNQAQVITKIVVKNERPSPMPDIPIQFIKLIEMCWKQDPKERPDILQVIEILKQVQATILLKQAQNSNQETTRKFKKNIHSFFCFIYPF